MTLLLNRGNRRTKLLITDHRNRLNPDIIEASECYVSWAKTGLIDDTIMVLNS